MTGWKAEKLEMGILAITALAWLMAACTSLPPTPNQSPTLEITSKTPTIVVTSIASPVAVSTLIVDSSPTPSPTVKPTPQQSCPREQTGGAFDYASSVQRLDQDVIEYLNAGGEINRLVEALPLIEGLNAAAVVEDLDGDGLSEVLITYTDSQESQAWVDVLHCAVGEFVKVAEFEYGEAWFASFEFVSPLRDNGHPFVVSRVPRTRGWVDDYIALGWDGTSWKSVALSSGLGPSQISLYDQNGDGVREVQLSAMTSVTPGGGLGRVEVSTWAWNGTAYAYSSSRYLPGTDRVHYIADAERAWIDGNPLLAVTYYEVAARSDDLSAYPTGLEMISGQTEVAEAYQRAFSLYRIIATWTYQNRLDDARVYFEELKEKYPDGEAGSEFIAAADILMSEAQTGAPYARACSKSASALDQSTPKLVPTHLGDWGVANPMYFRTTDVCDFNVIGR